MDGEEGYLDLEIFLENVKYKLRGKVWREHRRISHTDGRQHVRGC